MVKHKLYNVLYVHNIQHRHTIHKSLKLDVALHAYDTRTLMHNKLSDGYAQDDE